MNRLFPLNNFLAFVWDTVLVYVAYMVCRLAFVLTNWDLYAGRMTWGHGLSLLRAGWTFDTSAIFYTNAVVMLMMMLPLPWKERKGYYGVVRWVYVVVNGLAVCLNLVDCVYFPFTGKRTTLSVVQEFCHEGRGEMVHILGWQMVANWYLVLLAGVLVWGFWRGFSSPLPRRGWVRFRGRSLLLYLFVNLVLMVGMSAVMVAGMRGGWMHATRPITISNANQYVERPAETGMVLNTPFCLIRTLGKKPFVTPRYMSDEEAELLFSPVHRPVEGTVFRPLNVVVLIMESFGKQHSGVFNEGLRAGGYEGFTPFLDSLVRHGARSWEQSFANGRKSIESMPSVLSSLPSLVEPLFLTPASLNAMSGLARELSEHKGYRSAFFHGAENGSMGFQAFAKATGFQEYWGRKEYDQDPHYGGDGDFDGTWAIWDEEFLQFYADRMDEMEEPFMTAVLTATSHSPFALPERYKGVFPRGEKPIQECVAYSDHALQHFFDRVKKADWFGRTVFVITADHVSGQVDPYYCTSLGYYRVPVILYAPGLEGLQGMDRERVVEQIDIMPTVLGLLGYDRPYVAFGQDMLNTPADETIALHWVPESDCYQFVKGDYVLDFDGKRLLHAYRHRTDSLLEHDVLGSMPADTLQRMERQMKSFIQQYMKRMNEDRLTDVAPTPHGCGSTACGSTATGRARGGCPAPAVACSGRSTRNRESRRENP